MFHLVSIRL